MCVIIAKMNQVSIHECWEIERNELKICSRLSEYSQMAEVHAMVHYWKCGLEEYIVDEESSKKFKKSSKEDKLTKKDLKKHRIGSARTMAIIMEKLSPRVVS